SMWPMTNPNRITPLTANAAFLPTDVSNSVRAFCVAMSSEHGAPCRDDAGALPLCAAQVHSLARLAHTSFRRAHRRRLHHDRPKGRSTTRGVIFPFRGPWTSEGPETVGHAQAVPLSSWRSTN